MTWRVPVPSQGLDQKPGTPESEVLGTFQPSLQRLGRQAHTAGSEVVFFLPSRSDFCKIRTL